MKPFRIPVFLLLITGVSLFLLCFRTSCERPKDYGRETAKSSPVLENALRYVKSQPRYKSRYYAGGWPDDGCGTCTDVVGFALLWSGVDLRKEVYEDRLVHPERYGSDEPDIDIDFRRVRNLIPFFEHHGEVLTADIHETDAWQGGDIVIFRSHIGIVSDRRNERGIPYVIHHAGPYQLHYEEDILERRNDIVLHVRIGLE